MRDVTLNNWVKLVTNPIYCSICGHVTYAEKKLKVHEKKHATDGAMARVNEKLILDAKAAATTLLASLDEGAMSREERRAIEQTPVELQQRYGALRVMMAERCQDLDSALAACQGVQDALNNIDAWLNSMDKAVAGIMKPASLIKDRLDG